jgi:hypothetical protein
MRRVAVGALAAVLFSAPVFAQMADVDTDGDGMASYEELVAVYPSLTEDAFVAMDTNEDGVLDEAEMAAAIEAGTLVKDAG